MQAECKQYLQQNSPLVEGQVLATSAGYLSASYVFHMVVPRWQGGAHQEISTLENGIDNCFDEAEARGIQSLAIPFLEISAAGFPVDVSTKTIVQAILSRKKCKKFLPPSISLVSLDFASSAFFKKELTKHFQMIHFLQPRPSKNFLYPTWHYKLEGNPTLY